MYFLVRLGLWENRPEGFFTITFGTVSEAALIVAQSAQHNRQSRGCHYRVDLVKGGMVDMIPIEKEIFVKKFGKGIS